MTENVLVLDDDPGSREALVRTLQATDFNTLAPSGPFRTLEALCEFAKSEGVTHLVTDHRLRERPFASFLGAAAAGALNVMKVAPILVTAYAQQDMDHNIRPYLSAIPRIIQRHANAVDPRTLREALNASSLEVIEGRIPRSRRSYRSIVSVEKIVQHQKAGPRELRLMVRQWRKDVTVGFPAAALPAEIQQALEPGLLLIAQVNIEAEAPERLFLKTFELPNSEDVYAL